MAALQNERATRRSTEPAADLEYVAHRDAWQHGDLRYKLQPHQQPVFDAIMDWVANPPDSAALGALYDSVFVLDIARRWGKTTLCLVILYIWALTLPKLIGRGALLTYATREKDQIKRIVIPIHRMLCADAPPQLKPRYMGSHEGMQEGLYFPDTAGGSMIKLVGVDKDPDRLRGEGSDGGVFSEAGHMKDLYENVAGVFLPQFQHRPHARLILESTAPDELEHDYDENIVPDAKLRGAYVFGTIDDNTSLSDEDKERALREAGGRQSYLAQREYYGVRKANPERSVFPEFDEQRHVGRVVRPEYAHAFVFEDPGTRDLFGLVWAYWHFELAKLICLRSWAKRNAGTAEVAEVIKATNAELFGDLKYWDGPVEHDNPALMISDVDPRLQLDMKRDHDLPTRAADKSKNNYGTGEAKLYRVRNALKFDLILIDPDDPGPLRTHLKKARWNETRTDFERVREGKSGHALGHFDCAMCLTYGWDAIQPWRGRDPERPALHDRHDQERVFGPRYKEPMTRNQSITEAMQAGRSKADRKRAAKCPVCGKVRVLATWMNGQFVCSQECHDKWVYRATGGKPP